MVGLGMPRWARLVHGRLGDGGSGQAMLGHGKLWWAMGGDGGPWVAVDDGSMGSAANGPYESSLSF